MAKLLASYPRPWRIEITRGGGIVIDRDGNWLNLFDPDDDLDFWTDIVAVVNAHEAAPDMLSALKTAIGHIEHMAAFIAAQKAGYSFEGLGEDVPGIRAAIAKAEGGDP